MILINTLHILQEGKYAFGICFREDFYINISIREIWHQTLNKSDKLNASAHLLVHLEVRLSSGNGAVEVGHKRLFPLQS